MHTPKHSRIHTQDTQLAMTLWYISVDEENLGGGGGNWYKLKCSRRGPRPKYISHILVFCQTLGETTGQLPAWPFEPGSHHQSLRSE